jgi:hypothetical protein
MSIKQITRLFTSEARQYVFNAGYNDMESLEKTSAEIVPVEWEFAPILPAGEILSSTACSVLMVDSDGVNVASAMVGAVEVLDNTRIRTKLSTGISGTDYKSTLVGITIPNGYRVEGHLLLQIRDKTI